jgi:hypothetical protein
VLVNAVEPEPPVTTCAGSLETLLAVIVKVLAVISAVKPVGCDKV